jgi:hypothetical protein
MSERIEKARAAFTKIYEKDLWALEGQDPQTDLMQRFATLAEETMRRCNIRSVVEVGCGFWSYAKLVDWSRVTYDGFDVAPGVINYNGGTYGTPTIRFHLLANETELLPADLLICRDVLQHLPTEDVLNYLGIFRNLFSHMLIVNDISPADNLNGPIEHAGYRALRLDLPPFNETYEILDEWDAPAFGVPYHKQACLLRGTRSPSASTPS